jgi:hypothetical protein
VVVPIVVIVPYCTTTTTSFLEKNAKKNWNVAIDNGRHPSAKEMLYTFLYQTWNNNTEDKNKDKLNYNLLQSEYQYTVFEESTSTRTKCFVYSSSVKFCYSPLFNEKVFYTSDARLMNDTGTWRIELLKGALSMDYPRFDANGKLAHN